MAKVTIFESVLKNEIQKIVALSKDIENLARIEAQKVADQAEKEFFSNFDNHPVTKELEEGKDAENISGTLNGYYGNLFSFIGFKQGSAPIGDLKRLLQDGIKLRSSVAKKSRTNTGVEFVFELDTPSMYDIEDLTPMPWEEGRSWVRGIERGISGLSSYLSGNYANASDDVSRSKTGTIAKNPDGTVRKIRPGSSFKNVKYLSDLLRKFRESVKR